MKVVAVFVNPVLFAFSFSLAMGHTAFTTLADRAVHVLGQFQHFNQICKLLHGKCIVVNAIDLQLKLTHVLHSKLTHPCNEDYVS